MTRHHLLLTLLLVLTLAACRSVSAPHAASLDQDIQLAPGEQVELGEQGLSVEFVRVVEDSRCPTDLTCVWAGEVKVQLSTRLDGAEAVRHEITAGQHATVGAFRVIVVQVEPERVSTHEILPEQYRVTVRAERAPADLAKSQSPL